jgi:hypothetical protein
MDKHFIVYKCTKCPFKYKGYFGGRGNYCNHPNIKGLKTIELKGKKYPKWCPLDDYTTERCDSIQLKRKKMLDSIKRKKRCKK